ncbi:MAG: bifunctional oligoribonuclease/PAP phosphatase NrnA [Persephonella sp.]|nr:MAG: bifunctional oligoribonuclease/PAP phosphatase NrnA [Persephonella sp.]RUM60777.1 MAG: bifunctional oligoribonuclease/PAP phosphatase NrnA [Persephonella sp.]
MEKTIEKLKNFDGSILIFTHENPDGDGIGSMLALYKFLKKKNKDVEMAMKDEVPYIYNFLKNIDKIKKLPIDKTYDLAILVDAAGVFRAGAEVKAKEFMRIDHHRNGERYGEWDYIDISAPSTTTLVTKLLRKWDEELIDKDIAESLYVGLLTDTGSFRHSNITPEIFDLAKFLVEKGANPSYISQQVFERNKPETLKLLNKVLSTLQLHNNGKVASLIVKKDFFDETGTKEEDTEGFVNYARGLDGVDVAFIMIQKPNNPDTWRVSLRSKGDFNVEKVAKELGGGGHKNASGCRIKGEEKEVKEKILNVITKNLNINSCSTN